jgi:hypothetical protein
VVRSMARATQRHVARLDYFDYLRYPVYPIYDPDSGEWEFYLFGIWIPLVNTS